MLAHVCGYTVGELIISTGDTHIYKNHVDQVKEQLSRDAFPNPALWLNSEIKEIDKFTINDIKLVNYESHGTIRADMAV
jgi:thymidylate synthase